MLNKSLNLFESYKYPSFPFRCPCKVSVPSQAPLTQSPSLLPHPSNSRSSFTSNTCHWTFRLRSVSTSPAPLPAIISSVSSHTRQRPLKIMCKNGKPIMISDFLHFDPIQINLWLYVLNTLTAISKMHGFDRGKPCCRQLLLCCGSWGRPWPYLIYNE